MMDVAESGGKPGTVFLLFDESSGSRWWVMEIMTVNALLKCSPTTTTHVFTIRVLFLMSLCNNLNDNQALLTNNCC